MVSSYQLPAPERKERSSRLILPSNGRAFLLIPRLEPGAPSSRGIFVSVASTGFSVPGSRLDATVAEGFVSVAFRGVRKAEGKGRGFLVESRGAHPLCDGNSAEAYEREGVAGAPVCRVCRVGAGFR